MKWLLLLLLSVTSLSAQSVRIVYSYNRTQYDSLMIIVQKQNKILHDKNYKLSGVVIREEDGTTTLVTKNITFITLVKE